MSTSYGGSSEQGVDLANPLVGRAPGKSRSALGVLCVLAIFVFSLTSMILAIQIKDDNNDNDLDMISDKNTINACLSKNLPVPVLKPNNTTPLGDLFIYNCTLWTVLNNLVINNGSVLVSAGVIQSVGPWDGTIPASGSIIKLNAQGRIVTPGLVDLHSHLGVYAQPDDQWANSDGNEYTNPLYPQVRSLDAINPKDLAIPLVLSGGITSAQILPGSANLMGGEGTIVKLRGVKQTDLLMSNSPRTLKMACGENPKRNYGGRDPPSTPASRMGNGWLFRKQFEAAQKKLDEMTNWCSIEEPTTNFPSNLELDPLIALMRGTAILHNHCYTVGDMETMIRLSKEFGFKISAFHHAIDAYKLATELAANNISSAIFSDAWNFKVEAMDQSVYASKILNDANAKVVLKSDHPVLNARFLLIEAAKAAHYGLPPSEAIKAVTLNPANALTLGDRIGAIAVGYDGDFVVWDRDPLVLGATPDKVIVDGVVLVNNNLPVVSYPSHTVTYANVTETGPTPVCTSSAAQTRNCYAIFNATVYADPPNAPLTQANIIVQNGAVTCVGTLAACPVPGGCQQYGVTANTGVVVPGFVESFTNLGLVGISSEQSTQDGQITGTDSSVTQVHAADGIRVDGKFVTGSWLGGVTTSITRPNGNSLVSGISVLYRTCCAPVADDLVVNRDVALNINLGNPAKGSGGFASAISGQITTLRNLFESANASTSPTPALAAVLAGTMPVLAGVNSAEQITALLRLQAEFGFKLIIAGAAEAHLVADKIVAAGPKVQVIVVARPWPITNENSRTVDDNAARLVNAGIKIGLAINDIEFVRNARWEAGYQTDWGMNQNDALASITSNVADMFGLTDGTGRIRVGDRANFLLYNGPIFSYQTYLQIIGSGTTVQCNPRQS